MPDKMSIAQQNDFFRTHPLVAQAHGIPGRVVMTTGVASLDGADILEAIRQMVNFRRFNPDNDPYGEHDFGAFDHNGRRFFWKFDYYDTDYKSGSPDPSDPNVTARALTLMLACEY